MKEYLHIPIMKDEVIKNLINDINGNYIDCTFGTGGHSRIILSNIGKLGKLISIDRDYYSLNISNSIIDKRFTFYNCLFSNLHLLINKIKLKGYINGIIIDLGFSNNQLMNSKRGFSFIKDGPLDMRMNNKKGKTAFEIINNIDINKLEYILKEYGNEHLYKKISYKIISEIKNKKFLNSTNYLSNLILNIKNRKFCKHHPSTKTFQSIRILVNNEIYELNALLNNVYDILIKNGKLLIISFNSLESKIIKDKFNEYFFKKKIQLIKKIKPSIDEIKNNYSSRSAILRIYKKIN